MRVSVLSIENLTVHIVTPDNADPTGNAVRFAFTNLGSDPVSGDWAAGSWTMGTDVASDGRPAWVAETALVGPAQAHDLSVGRHWAWYEITDGSEVIVQQYDELEVY